METAQQVWHNVVVVAFGKDLIAFFDPHAKKSFLVPWSEVRRIEGKRALKQTGGRGMEVLYTLWDWVMAQWRAFLPLVVVVVIIILSSMFLYTGKD